MKSFVIAASAIAIALASVGSANAQKLDANDMARAPAVTGVSMSRDGTTLVGIIANPKNPDERALGSWDMSNVDINSKGIPLAYVTPSDKMVFWNVNALKQGKVIIRANQVWTGALAGCGEGRTTGATKTYVDKILMTDRTLKDLEDPFAAGRQIGVSAATQKCLEIASFPTLIDLPLDPENVIVQRADQTTFESQYSKVSLKTGRSELLYRDIGELAIDLIDPRDGKIRTKQKVDPKGNQQYNAETYVLNPETGRFDLEAPLTVDYQNRNEMSVVGFDEETGKYFVVTDKYTDHAAIYLYDARTDKFDLEPLFAHKDFDAVTVVLGRNKSDFGKILGFAYAAGNQEVYWVDPEMKQLQATLENSYKGQRIVISSFTDDRSKVLFATESPRNPRAYYVLVNKTKAMPLGSERPWIKPETMGPRTLVYYDARDGLKIPAFLTLPPNWKKGDAPPAAIVHPHGGPWARDNLGWDGFGWTQYLATRGYAVLQPQYRGSQGWGHKLWLAGDMEWGQKMQDDKDDGAAWLVKEGYAAKERIAIFGYSYGGFAAFAASVRPNGPFKCAIAGAGVSNLARIGQNWGENRQQRAYQGRTVKGMDPQQNTSKLSMPILIFHGDRDVRVPLFHATDFYSAVKSTGKAKLVILKDMGHQGDKWTAQNARDALNAMDDFLANDCKL
ncbi:MAG: prolyl oligopeptidase family serine peptidase [Hyphomonadaceae bacterium]|nr:prolyl oligopeptidase family serine peptidase [Hyphomonadaceae bacterium]